MTVALTAAAAEGDRSENAEYIYRKKQLREIDRRIRYLQKRLDEVQAVPPRRDNPGRVYFGAQVTLETANGEHVTYRIVGADETDAERGWISVDSPVARSLLGKAVDEEVKVWTPTGERHLAIIDVVYGLLK